MRPCERLMGVIVVIDANGARLPYAAGFFFFFLLNVTAFLNAP